MAICASSLFTTDESSYCRMLDDGGILVGDKWFGKDSTEADRARYLASFLRRQERNRRRCERRKVAAPSRKERHPPHRIPTDPESQRAHRMPLERRKCLRRTTIAACPTPSEVRTAWRYRNDSEYARVRLGGLLMDLECYVDNSLIVIGPPEARKVVARHAGLKGWIREKCPELESHYKTLQRIKGIAKRLRQRMDIVDPMPLIALLSDHITEEDLASAEVHVQPRARPSEPVRFRFVWEISPMLFDADRRVYFLDENYGRVNFAVPSSVSRHIPVYRSLLNAVISLNGAEKCTNETYSRGESSGNNFSLFTFHFKLSQNTPLSVHPKI